MLTDILMPGINGWQLADLVREGHPSMKILFMSGHTTPVSDPEEHPKHGAAFIQKPFSSEALSRLVREALAEEGKEGE